MRIEAIIATIWIFTTYTSDGDVFLCIGCCIFKYIQYKGLSSIYYSFRDDNGFLLIDCFSDGPISRGIQ